MSRYVTTEGLARISARRPKTVIAAWAGVLVASFVLLGTLFGGALTTEFFPTNNPDSERAQALINDQLRGEETVTEVVLVRSDDLTVDAPRFRAEVERLYGSIIALGADVVAGGTNYYLSGDESLVSEDRGATIIPLSLAGSISDAERNIDGVYEIVDEANALPGLDVLITGDATFSIDFSEQAQRDAQRGEAIGIPIALIILAVVFGALGAATLPMVLAIGSIIVALAFATLVGQVYDLHVFTMNIITMIGLAVGIDYSLFIVSRFREERAKGNDVEGAIATTGATASRAVLFSGLTVMVALLGMLIVPHTAFFSFGLGAIAVVIAAVAASLTLLPALLSLLGDRVNRLRVPVVGRERQASGEGGAWDRIAHAVMRRPVLSFGIAASLMVAATIPYFGINIGSSGISTFPDGLRAKMGFVAVQEEFGFGLNSATLVAIDGDVDSLAVQGAIGSLRETLEGDAIFGPATFEQNAETGAALLTVPTAGDPNDPEVVAAVERLRERYVPAAFAGSGAAVFVGGLTAEEIDLIQLAEDYTPIVLALVLGLSFVLLMLVFRSIVVPIKAIVLNLLSVGAAYGLLVLVFQEGVGAGLLGFEQSPAIQPWLPLFLFSVLFGLSMDYHVFLLSRIRERYDETGDNAESVAFGLRTTGGLITGAALIMVAVFGGFAAGELVPMQQMGFGLAVAVLLDATIVRSVLVPASMRLLGDWNWYFPDFLSWLPDIRIEGAPQPDPVPVSVEAGD